MTPLSRYARVCAVLLGLTISLTIMRWFPDLLGNPRFWLVMIVALVVVAIGSWATRPKK